MPTWGELQEDQLRYMARTVPDEVAYRNLDAGTALTFAEWERESNRLARGLVELGVQGGERVSIYLPSDEAFRWVIAYAGVHKAGATVVPTNIRLTVPELVTILSHAEATALLTCESLLATALVAREQLPAARLVVSEGGTGDDVHAWSDALADDGSEFQVRVEETDLADVMYTSGTTGAPKAIAVSHRTVATVRNLEPTWTGDGWIHGAPMFTFAGISFIYNPMKLGCTGFYQPKFDAGAWLRYVETLRPARCMLVPAFAELIVVHPDFETANLSSLHHVSVGSAPIAPKTLLTLMDHMPQATIANSYGMTEAGAAFILMPHDEMRQRVGSVGKPIPPMEIRILDDDEHEVAVREVGELLMRKPGDRREYFKDESATASMWTDDGWLRTGDLAYVDEDGYLYICGRKKDMIIRGGNNIYATDVEAVLLDHPDVQEAAVAGIPHQVLGEDVAAWVVRRPGSTLGVDDLLAFCAERLADYKCPRQVQFVDELPRNATGKVMKHKLPGR
ncbi:MAG: long-chain fatty acid--CoA ligase [Acidimicrobiia bacterium]|nr:long-chain fatty acid--CoA ligase [Acidimicrobiia bacterium]